MARSSLAASAEEQKQAARFAKDLIAGLASLRSVRLDLPVDVDDHSIPDVLSWACELLRQSGAADEASALDNARDKITRPEALGGLGISGGSSVREDQYREVIFQCEAWLESIDGQKESKQFLSVSESRPSNAEPMTLAEKIFTQHALGGATSGRGLRVGDVVRVGVDWILASELSWSGMAEVYDELGSPGIWRNDRLWIAGDHVVHPENTKVPQIKTFIETAERAKQDLRLT